MKGDFTRSTFRVERHYSSVRSQQGRVQVDADWNEEIEIQAHRDGTTRRDLIGGCGGPQGQDGSGAPLAGFQIEASGAELQISRGRYYVDGLLCENEATVAITAQPDLPVANLAELIWPSGSSLVSGTYLAYLDVWERHITALEDPQIREVALGGPDTATRTQVVSQVRLLPVTDAGPDPVHCATDFAAWQAATTPSSGTLTARAEPESGESDPCIVPAQAGYRGLENQLYRVEVHRVVSPSQITLKWSRENGSIVMAWTGQDNLEPNKLIVQSSGRDVNLGLAADDWVELTDDRRELRGEPGLLVKILQVDDTVLTVDPSGQTILFADFGPHPKMRRWDMPGDVGEIGVDLSTPDLWIPLELGAEVQLAAGSYRSGDYWQIPARTASRDIEWPRSGSTPLPQPPRGIHHRYCRLALLSFDGANWSRLSDCRTLFPPLTQMVHFFHVAGDGQEAMPITPDLPQPLQVGVTNGELPVTDARVRFRILDGASGQLQTESATGSDVISTSGPDGIFSCAWRLAETPYSQRVEATLLEIDGKPPIAPDGTPLLTPIRFYATLSIAAQVHYDAQACINPAQPATVQAALDDLCRNASLHYIGGDGQETLPGGSLPQPLLVRVANGQWPVAGAVVEFRILQPGAGTLQSAAESGPMVRAETDESGLAVCTWRLDAQNRSQQVEAVLAEQEPALPVRFTANLSMADQVAYDPANCPTLAEAGANSVQAAIDLLCQSRGDEPGIHVLRLNLATGQLLQNDSFVDPRALAQGIVVTCDRPLEPELARDKPICFVTLHMPYPLNPLDRELWGSGVIGFQPLILAGSLVIEGRRLIWNPTARTRAWLGTLIPTLRQLQAGERVLAFLTLKGSFIWSEGDTERPLYLDGNAFGRLRPDGSGVDLILPSGDGQRGGDLESWFWLSDQAGGGRVNVGLIPNFASERMSAQTQRGLNLALNRQELVAAGVLPADYQAELNQPFQPDRSRLLLQPMLIGGADIKVLAGNRQARLAETAVGIIANAVGVAFDLEIVPQAELAAIVAARLAAGERVDAVIGDDDTARRLSSQLPNRFDGSLVRF